MKQKQNETEHLLSTDANRHRLLEDAAERLYPDCSNVLRQMAKETFIEGAKWQKEQYTVEEQHIGHTIDELDKEYIKGFNEGSAWQQERSYSEEEMAESFMACWKANVPEGFECKLSFNEWFEQFKNK
jgi:hypothetical protein